MSFPEVEVLNRLVSRVFRVEDVTLGDPQKYLVRYHGQLLEGDTEALYDQLAEAVQPHGLIPLFRMEGGRQTVYLVPQPPAPPKENIRVNLLLFALTVLSVMLMGAHVEEPPPPDALGQILAVFKNILSGTPFALSLMGILLAHELGHYFMSRKRKTPASLPYFIPLPFLSPLGTMGAAIFMRGVPKNKRVLFDIGVAGPIAGLVVAVPVLFLGLSLSTTGIIEPNPNGFLEGNSLLYLLAKYLTFGKLLPAPAEPQSFLYWLKYFFTGSPVPFGGEDVFIHNVAFAGWAGLLVTALNLIPAGTLDGGHVMYALFGEKVKKAFPYLIGLLLVLGIFWSGWWLWAAILFWLGRVNAEPMDQITELDPARRALAYAMILVFALVFMPVPFTLLAP